MRQAKHKQNICGSEIKRHRIQGNITQEELAARCQVLGLKLSRSSLAHIENGIRSIRDHELFIIAKALKIEQSRLYPPLQKWNLLIGYTKAI
jgi:transcriptional regulator with XRE-family HTH domain